jgi:hypothetical protein
MSVSRHVVTILAAAGLLQLRLPRNSSAKSVFFRKQATQIISRPSKRVANYPLNFEGVKIGYESLK